MGANQGTRRCVIGHIACELAHGPRRVTPAGHRLMSWWPVPSSPARPAPSAALRERGEPRVPIEGTRARQFATRRVVAPDRLIAVGTRLEDPLPHRQAGQLVLE